MQKIEFEINREKLQPAGIHGFFVSLDLIEGDTRSDEERLNDQTEREFEVKGVLSRKVDFSLHINATVSEQEGESFFQLPEKATAMPVTTQHGEFVFHKNRRHEISHIVHRCIARGWQEAFSRFHSGITPFLDHLSYKANCPVHLNKVICWDFKNDLYAINFVTPYPVTTISPAESGFPRALIPIYALYREAKTNPSSYYRFLCYYKIMEGIYSYLRPELMKKVKEKGIQLLTRKERVPFHEEFGEEYQAYVGKSIEAIFRQELREEYRRAVAHYVLKNGQVLNVSDYHANLKFMNLILFSEVCCRVAIETQEWYLEQFEKLLASK